MNKKTKDRWVTFNRVLDKWTGYLKQPDNGIYVNGNDIYLYGQIVAPEDRLYLGDSGQSNAGIYVSGISFVKALKSIQGDVTIRINSPGGVVSEASVMHQALSERRKNGGVIRIQIDGVCASAATLLLPLADIRRISALGTVEIHRAMVGFFGNAEDARELAGTLEAVDETIIRFYMDMTGAPHEEIVQMMSGDGTVMVASQAVEKGFVNSIYELVAGNGDEVLDAKFEKIRCIKAAQMHRRLVG